MMGTTVSGTLVKRETVPDTLLSLVDLVSLVHESFNQMNKMNQTNQIDRFFYSCQILPTTT